MILGICEAPQTVCFANMAQRQQKLVDVILQDPAVESLSSFIGIDGTNTTLNSGRIQITLKPLEQRDDRVPGVIRRLQPKLADVDGITLFMQPLQDLTVEDRVSRTQFQYSLEDPDANELATWTRMLVRELRKDSRASRRRQRPAGPGPGGRSGHRSRHRVAAGHCRCRRSTTRSTTPSASARSPPSSRSSISTTWSWRWSQNFQMNPASLEQSLREIVATARRCRSASSSQGAVHQHAARHRPPGSVPGTRSPSISRPGIAWAMR